MASTPGPPGSSDPGSHAAGVELELPRTLERGLSAGHPWVYRDHVSSAFRAPTGAWVRVRAGGFSGYGLWDPGNPIALRMVSARRAPDAAWWHEQVARAWALRAPLREGATTAYRWLFGEGDGVPGITVDLYGRHAVVVTYADAADVLVPALVPALLATAPLDGVVRRRRGARGEDRLEVLAGAPPPQELVVVEHGVRLRAALDIGQKTGLFLDHREHRRHVRGLAAGRRVLNLFAYTGGFSVNAALGGAAHVASVDIAPGALDAARENFALNGLDPAAHAFHAEDCVAFLERAVAAGERWDLVVCDPPSFARSRDQLPGALKAYRRLNALALRATADEGLLLTASCTAQLSPEAFREVVADAAARVGRRMQLVHEGGHPLDHPVMLHHPEGRYLKVLLGRVLR